MRRRVPVEVAERAKTVAQAKPSKKAPIGRLSDGPSPVKNEKKAKLVAALKRLHPMD